MVKIGAAILVVLGWLLLEVLQDIVMEVVLGLGWATVRTAHTREQLPPLFLALGWGAVGLCVGFVTLVVLPKRVTPPGPVLGISLAIAPLLTGTVTHALGVRWSERAKNPPHGFTFVAGASFAFMMSLTRFSYIVLHWPFG